MVMSNWQDKEDVGFQAENLYETIEYCKAHNAVIVDKSHEEVENLFWKIVKEKVGPLTSENLDKKCDDMEPVYNAWFIVQRTLGPFPDSQNLTRKNHTISFFVRLGREPIK